MVICIILYILGLAGVQYRTAYVNAFWRLVHTMGQVSFMSRTEREHILAGTFTLSGQVSVRIWTRARCSMHQNVWQFGCGKVYFGSSLWRNWEKWYRWRRESGCTTLLSRCTRMTFVLYSKDGRRLREVTRQGENLKYHKQNFLRTLLQPPKSKLSSVFILPMGFLYLVKITWPRPDRDPRPIVWTSLHFTHTERDLHTSLTSRDCANCVVVTRLRYYFAVLNEYKNRLAPTKNKFQLGLLSSLSFSLRTT